MPSIRSHFGFDNILTMLVCLLLGTTNSLAAEYSFTSDTIVRFFERDTIEKTDTFVAPIYEYLQVDLSDGEENGVSMHGYGWARGDMASGNYFDEDTDGELLYGYVEYGGEWNDFVLRLGRQHIFSGKSNESLDGLSGSTELSRFFLLSAYAGYPVTLNRENGYDGDSLAGGRIEYHLGSRYRMGLSYKTVGNDGSREEEVLGVDMSLVLPGNVSLHGYSTQNILTDSWSEHSYDLRVNLFDFQINSFFQQFRYEDFLGIGVASSNPFRFLAGTGETLTLFGGDLLWYKSLEWETALEIKNYEYEKRGEDSQFFSGQLTWHGDNFLKLGGEIGYMYGDTAETRYILARSFLYWNVFMEIVPLDFVSWDLMFVSYEQEFRGEDSSLFSSLGCGAEFLDDSFSVTLSLDYTSDPYYDHDYRGVLSISYTFGND